MSNLMCDFFFSESFEKLNYFKIAVVAMKNTIYEYLNCFLHLNPSSPRGYIYLHPA